MESSADVRFNPLFFSQAHSPSIQMMIRRLLQALIVALHVGVSGAVSGKAEAAERQVSTDGKRK